MSAETASGPTEDQVEILEYNFNKVNKHPDPTTLCLIAAEAGLSEEETQILRFSQIEVLWQPCIKQAYRHHFPTTAFAHFVSLCQKYSHKCPSSDEWIKKMWHIYTMEYYSAIKRNEMELFVMRWIDLESVIQSEVSQKEKDKYRMLTHIYGI
ncbi:homeodomain-only protein isoform X1 [Orcinus orca]|uniref:homeodomain-only protein isoform X1 n=1 Tax=Orcinus orca TaxID=9733 RepID=UPI002111C2F0|nr:homeodomain-only protein isoform X1 [Orcinus orca]XP_049565289.1 homeodomain-only protein isoform X1 [Orcinus orca]XP_049565290.1 homeodomain-only protein isoform X1 [Orcinus orca]XP_049565291.1 homeodomain-only protein isoform X1 [Orcinus orca]XP_049565292.1 homeodomain-only protein isoform X1 [Orcinus orca]XP_049565293.1 homeodomain-only protein isoform X1 [Orcinus orca]